MESYFDYIAHKSMSLSQAMDKLEQNAVKLLFVAEEDRLLGVLTDGDVRRFLLSGGGLGENIMRVATLEPVCAEGFCEADARRILREQGITCVPMVARGKIHSLVFRDFTLHREVAQLSAHVVIMAGGFGTRLQPYTEILPKPLIPAGNMTITEQILERFKKFGCSDFTLVVNYKKNLIKAYFAEVDAGCNIEFVDEDEPLGTGGGLWLFKQKIHAPMFVSNCDTVIEADYADILKCHNDNGNAVTMVCAQQMIEIPYGVVEHSADGALERIIEKPKQSYLMNTGFYVVGPEFLALVEDNTYQPITDIIEKAKASGLRVGVYPIAGNCFVDIGQIEDLQKVEEKLK